MLTDAGVCVCGSVAAGRFGLFFLPIQAIQARFGRPVNPETGRGAGRGARGSGGGVGVQRVWFCNLQHKVVGFALTPIP